MEERLWARKGLWGFLAVTGLTLTAFAAVLIWMNNDRHAPFLILVFLVGSVGALVREHVEFRQLLRDDVVGLDRFLTAVLFSPLTGGVLALVVSALFASGLLSGPLFPAFTGLDGAFTGMHDLQRNIGMESQRDLFKLLAWGILAGYSERFVVEQLQALSPTKRRSETGQTT